MFNYTYNAHGDIRRIQSGNTNGVNISYDYDALNRLASATDAHSGATTYGYDDAGNLAGFAYPNGVTNRYTYDSLNRLTNMVSTHAGDLRASYRYTVAPSGHRLTAAENVATSNGVQTINRVYSYDRHVPPHLPLWRKVRFREAF